MCYFTEQGEEREGGQAKFENDGDAPGKMLVLPRAPLSNNARGALLELVQEGSDSRVASTKDVSPLCTS